MSTLIKRIVLSVFLLGAALPSAHAFWIWTPESGKWTNPKFSVKATPAEQLEYARSFFDAGQIGEAMREYKKLIKQYPKAREAAEAQFDIGRSWEALRKFNAAVNAYQLVIDKYPFSDLGPKVVERQYDIANKLMEGKIRDSKLAETLLGTEHKVVEIFRKVIRNAPYGPYAPSAQYKIGLYYQARGEYQEARDEFEKAMNDYPNTEWAESAKYQIALSDAKRSVDSQYDQKTTSVALDGFKEFIAAHPESELSQDAKDQIKSLREKEAENTFVVAEFYRKNKKYDSARNYYNTIVNEYSDTVWALIAGKKLKNLPAGGK